MTAIKYEMLRVEEPWLDLPEWEKLPKPFKKKARRLDRRGLIIRRSTVLLSRNYP